MRGYSGFVAYCTDKWLDVFTFVYIIKYRTVVGRWPSSSRHHGAAAAEPAAAENLIPKNKQGFLCIETSKNDQHLARTICRLNRVIIQS